MSALTSVEVTRGNRAHTRDEEIGAEGGGNRNIGVGNKAAGVRFGMVGVLWELVFFYLDCEGTEAIMPFVQLAFLGIVGRVL